MCTAKDSCDLLTANMAGLRSRTRKAMHHQVAGAVITCTWLPWAACQSESEAMRPSPAVHLGRQAGTCLLPSGLYKLRLGPSKSALHPPVTNVQLPEQHPVGINVHSFAHKALCQKLCGQAEGVISVEVLAMKK